MISWIWTSRLSIKNFLSLSPQDDAAVKCWGWNVNGQLGQGDTSTRGDDAFGACPQNTKTAFLVPLPL